MADKEDSGFANMLELVKRALAAMGPETRSRTSTAGPSRRTPPSSGRGVLSRRAPSVDTQNRPVVDT
jgi:hypothetical protein